MERTDYFKVYYDKHKHEMNERRLFDYYTKKFGKEFVDKIKANHGTNAIDILKSHSKLTIKLNKVQRRKDELQTELTTLENMKSKL
jgi:allophanate hydrolase subunit 1